MKGIKKYFGEYEMTWKRVIILAVISAVITALVSIVPAFKNSSLGDMATYPDVWFLYAMFIIMNCASWKEASLKSFVFFLVSQPLIYLIQVPFSRLGWQIFQYYRYWFIITVLVLPGAAIAYLVKKQNWLSVPIISVATGYLCYMGVQYTKWCIDPGTKHVLSAIFCIALALFFVFGLLENKKHKITAGIIMLVFLAGFSVYMFR